MAGIGDVYSKLKTTLLGTTTTKIDLKLDKAVKDIASYRSQSGRNGYIDLVKNLITRTVNLQLGQQSSIFGQGPSPAAFGQTSRLYRYRTYDSIISNINYCYRALNVLTDNILSPDDITKVSLAVKATQSLGDETTTDSKIQIVKQIIKRLKLEKNLNLIVRNTLLYGDFFCEITDEKGALISTTLLTESQYKEYQEQKQKSEDIQELIFENIEFPSQTSKEEEKKKQLENIKIILDYSAWNSDVDNIEPLKNAGNSKEDKESVDKRLKKMKLVYHDPRFIIRLQSALFPICFGYLVFPRVSVLPGTILHDEPVNNICRQIIQKLKEKIPQMEEFKDNQDLKDIVNHLATQFESNQVMNVRFVPPDKMIHFKIPTQKYVPYGESIFDSSQYSAKVLIALETALAVQRLSRSTEKRKIAIEIGLPRDARRAIESMKEEFRKRKVSLDSFGTVDTIPSMITTFEDIYIPQKDGKPFVDVSTFTEGNVDVRGKVDELKFLRDQLTASLGVPPSFLNIEENLSNKAALTEENILFARTVIGHQKYLSEQLTELVIHILDIAYPDDSLQIADNIQVLLPPPKSLQFEREAKYMRDFAELIETLDRIGIPKEYSRKTYLPNLDWTEINKYETEHDIETDLDPAKKAEEGGAGGIGGF